MKKLLLGLCLGILSVAGFSQTGLQGVFVEKLHVATAADHAADPNLPVGAVTYRVFLDLNTGWRLANIFGDPDNAQNIVLKTSSSNGFYNVSIANGGRRYGHEINYASLATGTLKFDTWFAFGGAAAPAPPNYYHGIVRSVANPNGIITLTTPTTRLTQTPPAGNDQELILYPMLDGTSTNNDFTSPNIGFYDLSEANYVQGPDANNHVLLGQFTTDGDFSYQFNIQLIGPAPARVSEVYVAEYPADATQFEFPALKGTAVPPIPPTVSGLTVNPVDVIVGTHVALSVTATDDAPGSISKVEFFRGTTLLAGTVTNAGDVYSLDYVTDVVGTFNITAVATDDENNAVSTSPVSLTVRSVPSNIAPEVNTLTVPATVNIGSVFDGSATASDADGTIASVQFFVNNIAVGLPDASSPYQFTYTAPATEQILAIKAVATDNQGAQGERIVNVSVVDTTGRYVIPNQTLSCNGSDLFYVPVVRSGSGITKVIGFDMVMGFEEDKVMPTGVVRVDRSMVADSTWTSYALRVQDDSIYVSLFFNGTAPSDTYFEGSGNVLRVEFVKKPAFGSADTITFGVNDFVESKNTGTISRDVTSGTFITVQDLTFTGSLKFWADNNPIVYVAGANLLTQIRSCDWTLGPVAPDALGNFDWDLTAANALSINVRRDIANTTDVISIIGGYDAYLTQKVLVNDRNFRPNVYQMIAMDVNQDGKISAGDLSQIMQRAALRIGEYKQVFNYDDEGNQILPVRASWDWTFVSNRVLLTLPYSRISAAYPEEDGVGFTKNHLPAVGTCIALNVDNFGSCPIIYDEEFLGIMLGDADGSYKTIGSDPLLKSAQANGNPVSEKSGVADDKVVFDLSKATLSNGYLTFPVSVSSETNVNSMDFSMQFDVSKLSFESVFNHSNNLQSLAYYNEVDQTLRLTSFSLQNYANDAAIISLRFKVKSENISSENLSSVKGYLNGSPAAVEITKLALDGAGNTEQIVKIYPNPAKDVINVELSENADIELIDILGRTVSIVKDVIAYQKHEINVESLPQGTYLMKIKMKVGEEVLVSIKKVIIKK